MPEPSSPAAYHTMAELPAETARVSGWAAGS